MTGISLHMQWPLTSHLHGSVSQRSTRYLCYQVVFFIFLFSLFLLLSSTLVCILTVISDTDPRILVARVVALGLGIYIIISPALSLELQLMKIFIYEPDHCSLNPHKKRPNFYSFRCAVWVLGT
jgi:hypothetical protein